MQFCDILTFAHLRLIFFFFSNHLATTKIYTLSLHDALPISWLQVCKSTLFLCIYKNIMIALSCQSKLLDQDRKSTRLNSSHVAISYAVFCLKKNKSPASTCNVLPDLHAQSSP